MPGRTVRKRPIGQRRLRRKCGAAPLRSLIRRFIKQVPFKYDESKNSTRKHQRAFRPDPPLATLVLFRCSGKTPGLTAFLRLRQTFDGFLTDADYYGARALENHRDRMARPRISFVGPLSSRRKSIISYEFEERTLLRTLKGILNTD